MSITVKGTVERKGMGPGTWALVSEDGKTYELRNPSSDLKQEGLKVKVEGQIREDVMTFAMVGPVLEVQHFQVTD